MIRRMKVIESVRKGKNSKKLCSLLFHSKAKINTQTNADIAVKRSKRYFEIKNFFSSNPHLEPCRKYFPMDMFFAKSTKALQNIYLICPNIAKTVSKHVLKFIETTQLICETNPGIGLISTELFKSGVPFIRLYERNVDFHPVIQELNRLYTSKMEFYDKDFFSLNQCSFLDKFDSGNRVSSLLNNIPVKDWNDEPAITIIGTMTTIGFIKYLVNSFVMERGTASLGRIQVFPLATPKLSSLLSASNENLTRSFYSWTVLLHTFFEVTQLDKFPRKFFIPWEASYKSNFKNMPTNYDPEHVNLYRIISKKELSLEKDEILPFYFFVKLFVNKKNAAVIPSLEKCLPGCGKSLILPKLKHEHYPEHISIFTKFKELTPRQLYSIFRELTANPNYGHSSFLEMMENEMLLAETIDSNLFDEFIKNKKNVET